MPEIERANTILFNQRILLFYSKQSTSYIDVRFIPDMFWYPSWETKVCKYYRLRTQNTPFYFVHFVVHEDGGIWFLIVRIVCPLDEDSKYTQTDLFILFTSQMRVVSLMTFYTQFVILSLGWLHLNTWCTIIIYKQWKHICWNYLCYIF